MAAALSSVAPSAGTAALALSSRQTRRTARRGRAARCVTSALPEAGAPNQPASLNRRLLLTLWSSVAVGVDPLGLGGSVPALAEQVVGAGEDEGRVDLIPLAAAAELRLSEKQVLEYNKRIQAQNRVPKEFPWFVRDGFNVKILADDYEITPEGLVLRYFQRGTGPQPEEGQKVIFHYTAYNESGSPIDSSYKQGRPSEMRMGASGMIPGFELALKRMEVGTQMRVIVPPSLGPPVGPSTFFSAKQCEVFDVEMLALKNCSRKQFGMVSNIVCDDI